MKTLLVGILFLGNISAFGQTFSGSDLPCRDSQYKSILARTSELALEEVRNIENIKSTKCNFKKKRFNSIARIYTCENFKIIVKFADPRCNPDLVKVNEVVLRY